MANEFTSEILNGNIETIKDYAFTCSKAFGATAHQKDEPLNTPLRNVEVGKDNLKASKRLEKQLKDFKLMSDEQLFEDEKKALEKTRLHYSSKIDLIKAAKKKCSNLLRDAQVWTPPTDDHNVLKDFMIKNLKSVIEFDCDIKPINELIEDIDGRISTIDVDGIRERQIKSLEQQIDYHIQSHKLDVSHSEQSNEWLTKLIKSF